MTIAQYFWDLNPRALKETETILKNPEHPQFAIRMTTLLSRCDKPKELFKIISKSQFVDSWPKIRAFWIKQTRQSDFRDWWETIYEELLAEYQPKLKKLEGKAPFFLQKFGKRIKEARIEKGLSQKQLALSAGMRQPDISRVEEGKKNVTLYTLARLCQILEIKTIDIL